MSIPAQNPLPMGNSPNRAAAKETLWRLFALAVAHPAREFHELLKRGEFFEAFNAAWSQLVGRDWPKPSSSGEYAEFEAGFITAFLHGRGGKPVAALLAGDHDHILAGLTRPVFMLNLTSFYKHFGLRAATGDEGRQDEPDHLSSMLEFMAVLCHLETGALTDGRDPSPYRRAQRDFLCRYLQPTLDTIAGLLRRERVENLDPTLYQLVQDMNGWSSTQITELEARVGPFRDPDAPKPAMAHASQPERSTQNLWG